MAQTNSMHRSSRSHRISETELKALYPEFSRLLLIQLNQLLPRQQEARQNLDEQILDTPGDDADLSVIDTSADYFLRIANSQQREIIETREALERISRGTYGLCENCSETISAERLRKLPEARFCIDCQSNAEHAAARVNPHPKL